MFGLEYAFLCFFFIMQRGRTALYISCCEGHLDVAEVLVENGADINFTDKVLML